MSKPCFPCAENKHFCHINRDEFGYSLATSETILSLSLSSNLDTVVELITTYKGFGKVAGTHALGTQDHATLPNSF